MTTVIRDSALIFGLTFIGGFALARFELVSPPVFLSTAYALTVLGYAIAGCLTPQNRFRHLTAVALVVWALGLGNVALGWVASSNWAMGLPFGLASMGVGGGLSLLIVNPAEREDAIGRHLLWKRLLVQLAAVVAAFLISALIGGFARVASGANASVTTGANLAIISMQIMFVASIAPIWLAEAPTRRGLAAWAIASTVGLVIQQTAGAAVLLALAPDGLFDLLDPKVLALLDGTVALAAPPAFVLSWILSVRPGDLLGFSAGQALRLLGALEAAVVVAVTISTIW